MRIYLGSDHAGHALRHRLAERLAAAGHEVFHRGPDTTEMCDYPEAAREVGLAVVADPGSRGVLLCGSGVGVSIAANKVDGVRAALAHDTYSAHQSVEHDDANVLCLGAQVIGPLVAEELVAAFIDASFDPRPQFVRRLEMVRDLEVGA